MMPSFLFGALTGIEAIYLGADEDSLQILNFIGPIILGIICSITVYRSILKDKTAILYPMTSALLASTFYFGFGPLFYFFGSESSYDYAQLQFAMDQRFLHATNLLNATFLFLVYTGHAIAIRTKLLSNASPKNFHHDDQARIHAIQLILFCVLAGGGAKYLLMDGKLASLASLLSHLTILLDICLAPMAYLAARGRTFSRILFAIMFVGMFVLSLMMFSKTAMMRSAAMALTGLVLGGTRPRWILAFSAVVFVQFIIFATPVANLRDERNKVFGKNDSTLSDHAKLISNMYEEGRLFENDDNHTTWFLRLNYAPTQAFAIHQYEIGRVGDSYKHAFWVFVPRILYPNKPSMTEIGIEYSTEFNGNSNNSVSIGIAGEAYNNGGVVMLLVIGLLLGVEFAFFERVVTNLIHSVWLYFPCFILIVLMGTRVDGHLVPDYIGTPMIIAAFYWLGRFMSMISKNVGLSAEFQQVRNSHETTSPIQR